MPSRNPIRSEPDTWRHIARSFLFVVGLAPPGLFGLGYYRRA